jgi:hypothetical protein
MSGWVKIPETWFEDETVEQIPSAAIVLHLSALADSARHLRDGRVPSRALRRLWPDDMPAMVEVLLAAGWWEPTEGGWHIPEWRSFILSADEIERKRADSRESSERHRRHKAGDHSMCDRCSFVKAGDSSPDTSVTPLRSEPLRSEPNRTEGEGRGRAVSDARPPSGSRAADTDGETDTRADYDPNNLRRRGLPCNCNPRGKHADGECNTCYGNVA